MCTRRAYRRGQVTVELALMFAVVVAAFIAMAVYYQRGVQGGVRSNADSLGQQFSANAAWTSNTDSTSFEDQSQVTTDQKSTYGQTVN